MCEPETDSETLTQTETDSETLTQTETDREHTDNQKDRQSERQTGRAKPILTQRKTENVSIHQTCAPVSLLYPSRELPQESRANLPVPRNPGRLMNQRKKCLRCQGDGFSILSSLNRTLKTCPERQWRRISTTCQRRDGPDNTATRIKTSMVRPVPWPCRASLFPPDEQRLPPCSRGNSPLWKMKKVTRAGSHPAAGARVKRNMVTATSVRSNIPSSSVFWGFGDLCFLFQQGHT